MSQWSIQMCAAEFSIVIASAPPEQSDGLSVQLLPTILRFFMMMFFEPCIWMWPLIVAEPPQAPTMVLFDPTVTLPEMVPLTTMTRAVDPPAALLRELSDVTVVDDAVPPPVVPPPCVAHPIMPAVSG